MADKNADVITEADFIFRSMADINRLFEKIPAARRALLFELGDLMGKFPDRCDRLEKIYAGSNFLDDLPGAIALMKQGSN